MPASSLEPGEVSASNGYSASVTDTWSTTVTADTEIGGIFSAGIQATLGQSVNWGHTFTANVGIPVNPGYTGYIWGDVPVADYTGTMTIQLGNTTWNVTNTQFASPDPNGALSGFVTHSYLGNDPLNSPQTPPAALVIAATERG